MKRISLSLVFSFIVLAVYPNFKILPDHYMLPDSSIKPIESHGNLGSDKGVVPGLQLRVFAGIVRNTFPERFKGFDDEVSHFNPSYSVRGGVNLLYSLPGWFKSFKLGLSLGYNGYHAQGARSRSTVFYSWGSNSLETASYYDTVATSDYLINQISIFFT